MMTPRENTLRLMSGRLPERVAFHDNIWGETLARWVGEGYPLEAKANCQALELAEKYAELLAFKGGLDARILESGDHALIKKEVAALVDGMKTRGARYIFGSDHSVSPKVSYDSFRYAVETYRAHMFY